MIKNFKMLSSGVVLLCLAVPAYAQPSPTHILGLNEAIQKAVISSPRLATARAALSAFQGAERQAGAWINPELSVEAENVAGSGAYSGTKSGEFTYALSQKLELGKRPARKRIASSEREVASIAMQAEKLDLARDVKLAYGDVLAAEENLKLTQAQEKLAGEVLANVSKRVSAARDPLIYRTQADVSHATAKMAYAQAQRSLQLAKKKLSNLWGGEALSQTLDATVLTRTEQPLPLETYQTKLAENPDLTRFTSMKLAKQAAVKLEKAQNIPDPSVNVGFRTFRDSKEQAMTVGMSLPIPVFDQNQGNIAKARAELNQVESESQSASLNVEQSLEEAWQEWQSAHQEATQLHDNLIPNAEKAFSLSREGYERGRFSYLEILNAQRTLSEARGQYNQSLQRQLTAKAQVERLIAAPINTPIQQEETK